MSHIANTPRVGFATLMTFQELRSRGYSIFGVAEKLGMTEAEVGELSKWYEASEQESIRGVIVNISRMSLTDFISSLAPPMELSPSRTMVRKPVSSVQALRKFAIKMQNRAQRLDRIIDFTRGTQ